MPIKKGLLIRIKKFRFKDFNKKKFLKTALITVFFLSAFMLGAVIGAYRAILKNLPSISELEEYKPNIITYIYSEEGEVIGEFAIEKRIPILYEEIPEILKKAIIATEDPRFYEHKGIDFLGILRAAREDIRLILKPRRLQGGSTISQQLARELFLHRKQTVRRKLKELILALQIERKYSKDEIMTMYCNQFNLGHGAYGVEAASQLYFGKKASDLDLKEAALITGIFRGPSLYSPYKRSELTLGRRNHVLRRMMEEGFITAEERDEVNEEPLNVLPLYRMDSDFAAFFKEEVRKYIEQNYGAEALYRSGLRVYTTLNTTLQRYAEEALKKGLHTLDKRQGWRKDKRNLLEEGIENLEELDGASLDNWPPYSWLKSTLEETDNVKAVVLSVERKEAQVRIGDYLGRMTNRDIDWTGTRNLTGLIKQGDVIQVKVIRVDEEKKELQVSLDQEPRLEGAFLVIEPQTGEIKTMVGGYSFRRLKFNQATQALRQPGSVIKPIIYTAALENGFTPATRIVDEPTDFIDQWTEEPWSPPNYDQKFKGTVTLRTGLEESRNIVTAKLLNYISPQTGVEYCRKFGITTPVYPYLSLSLGTFEVKMIEMVSAFTTFPNKGVRMVPYFISRIEDKEGNILEETKIESEEVISPQIAYMMNSLLRGVVQRGTGWRASYLEKPLCGKTGTTDEHSDAWFIGYSPSLCAGVWVGHEKKVESIGDKQSGAVAAQPIWIDFFKRIIDEEKRRTEEEGEEPLQEAYDIPDGLSYLEIDRKTGLLSTPFCLFPIKEVFLPGTEPNRFCSYEDHMLTLDYYEALRKEQEER